MTRRPGVDQGGAPGIHMSTDARAPRDAKADESCRGLVRVLVRRRARSGRAHQGHEVEILTCEDMALQLPRPAFNLVRQHGRKGGIEHRIAALRPGPVQHPNARRAEGAACLIEPFVESYVRARHA